MLCVWGCLINYCTLNKVLKNNIIVRLGLNKDQLKPIVQAIEQSLSLR